MKCIDLFAGAGLSSYCALQAGLKVLAAFELGFLRKSGSIDRSPLLSYVANHGAHIAQQDIRTLLGSQFTSLKPDLVMGGPPCQDFSIAGKRTGLGGYRGTLTFEFLRVAAESNSPWVLMENVPGILTSNEGQDVEAITAEAIRLGLKPAWQETGSFAPKHYHIFKSLDFGSPQHRRRVFFLWHRNGLTVDVPTGNNSRSSMGEALGISLVHDGPSPAIDAGGTTTGGWDLGQRSRIQLSKMGFQGRLSPEQCLILQGLPDSFIFHGFKTSIYKQIGNGWEVKMGTSILEAIKST